MLTIIHLSDLHIGYQDLGERFLCIVDNIMYQKKPAQKYVIVVTGDLVDDANDPANYDKARTYLGKLERGGFTVLVVPGNHDYGNGILGREKYVAEFKLKFFGSVDVTYPKVDIVGNMAFIGLDSMAEELHWYDALFAQGELGKPQLKRLDRALSSEEVRKCAKRVLYLHHHPFDPKFAHELKDSAALNAVVVKHGNVDALLYGHNHEGKKRNGAWEGIARCYDDGSATRKNGAPGHHRVMDLARDASLDYDGDFHCNF